MTHDDELIADELGQLRQEVQVLHQTIDELRTTIQWGVQNGRIMFHFDEAAETPVADPDNQTDPSPTDQPPTNIPPEPGSLF